MIKNIDESVKEFDNIRFQEVWEDHAYFLMQSVRANKDKLFCYKVMDDDDFCVAQWLSPISLMSMNREDIKKSINYTLFSREMESAMLDSKNIRDTKKLTHDLTIQNKEADLDTAGKYISGKGAKKLQVRHLWDKWDDDENEWEYNETGYYDPDEDDPGGFLYPEISDRDEFKKSTSKWTTYNKDYVYTPPKKISGLAADLKKSDTLVIHCKDSSTDMLAQIYEGRGWDVLRNGNIDEEELQDLLKCHDRIIMLGHGTPSGLINKQGPGFVINRDYADILREKDTYAIWCYSYEFAKSIGIRPGYFWTSNIPSEVGEEIAALGHAPLDKQEMLDNITYWAKLCAESIDMPPREAIKYIKERYTGTDDCSEYIRNHMMIT